MPLLLLPGEKPLACGFRAVWHRHWVAPAASSDQKSQFGVCPETLTCTPWGKGSLIITYDP